MDEYGSYVSQGDNTNTGIGFTKGTIALRGAGSVNWKALNKKYPSYYPSSFNNNTNVQQEGINRTCKVGRLQRYNGSSWTDTGTAVDYNYKLLGYQVLPSDRPIGSSAKKRENAHPITYKLKITQSGLLSLWWGYNGGDFQPILVDKDIISENGPLPSSFRFGFVGSTGGSTNYHDILCFKAAPAMQSDNNMGSGFPENEYKTESQIFVSLFEGVRWWSNLKAQSLLFNEKTKELKVKPEANWDASCALTGGVCNATGGNTVTAQSPDNRTIITYNGTKGTAFQWASLDTDGKNNLNSGDNKGALRLKYLRGERANEENKGGAGTFRERIGLLGDIVDSGPTWVGAPTKYKKQTSWNDKLTHGTMQESAVGAETYAAFKNKYSERLHVVYVGSNDGYLHGFRSGAYDAAGKFAPTTAKPNDGKEVLAYMPNNVLKRIHDTTTTGLDLSSPQYAHNYFNNATPGTGDLFYQGKWHTWLMSGLGSGGSAIYALDITDPTGDHDTDKKFSEGNARNIVIGEWSHKANDPVWKHLGNTYGTPEIGRFHDGQWGAVFGNGWCDTKSAENKGCTATSGKAGIYVMSVDKETGKSSFKFLDTGASGSPSSPNGIAYVTPVDLDNDNIIDYVYAGDIKGNVWRFDLTSNDKNNWGNAFKLFSTPSSQPITTKLVVSHKEDSRVMVSFGTGQKSIGYLYNPTSYALQGQSIYGIWDWNFASWNSQSSQKYIAYNYAGSVLSKSNLTQQTFDKATNKLSENEVCWVNQSSCGGGGDTNKYGWVMNLETRGQDAEQVFYNPSIIDDHDLLMVNTYIPGKDTVIACGMSAYTGYTYPLDITTGIGRKGLWTGNYRDPATRLELGATGAPSLVQVGGEKGDWYMLHKDMNSDNDAKRLHFNNGVRESGVLRLSWAILR